MMPFTPPRAQGQLMQPRAASAGTSCRQAPTQASAMPSNRPSSTGATVRAPHGQMQNARTAAAASFQYGGQNVAFAMSAQSRPVVRAPEQQPQAVQSHVNTRAAQIPNISAQKHQQQTQTDRLDVINKCGAQTHAASAQKQQPQTVQVHVNKGNAQKRNNEQTVESGHMFAPSSRILPGAPSRRMPNPFGLPSQLATSVEHSFANAGGNSCPKEPKPFETPASQQGKSTRDSCEETPATKEKSCAAIRFTPEKLSLPSSQPPCVCDAMRQDTSRVRQAPCPNARATLPVKRNPQLSQVSNVSAATLTEKVTQKFSFAQPQLRKAVETWLKKTLCDEGDLKRSFQVHALINRLIDVAGYTVTDIINASIYLARLQKTGSKDKGMQWQHRLLGAVFVAEAFNEDEPLSRTDRQSIFEKELCGRRDDELRMQIFGYLDFNAVTQPEEFQNFCTEIMRPEAERQAGQVQVARGGKRGTSAPNIGKSSNQYLLQAQMQRSQARSSSVAGATLR